MKSEGKLKPQTHSLQIGFTIVELLIVIVVIGILAAISIVAYNGIQQRARSAALISDLSKVSIVFNLYQVDNGGYPTANDCSASPVAGSVCLKVSAGNTYTDLQTDNTANPQTFCVVAINNGAYYRITNDGPPTVGTCSSSSCLAVLSAGKSIGDGIYWINPAGTPLQVYCDMNNDGGGWTLALQNNSTVATPSPNWTNAINSNNVSGTLSSDQASFDVLVGLGYWNSIGTQLKVQTGTSPSNISHKAIYTFVLSVNNNYAINLSNQNILLGVTTPGIYSNHNTKPFSTYDADHDTNAGNCATYYNNHPWWYTSCWGGNFFAGGGSFQEAAYWSGSTTDYYTHGSIWIK
ncbi:prepilin-type N-terminal cleavage/methylation domain-containing protein [Candidatus Saccharibacteria bacterium]|nr:prepilin-type N-terminal cleavage/methylation domain-containing protein [Candidatus Saccharibacteria bacterium]